MSLPGVNTVIKDRFFGLSRTNIPLGPRVGIIGRRTNDPLVDTLPNGDDLPGDLDPYTAINESDVISAFGEESDLHRGYLEALSGGATRVTLIAIPADTVFNHATGNISSADYDTASGTTNELFNDVFSAVESARVDIVVPWGRGSGPADYEDPATPSNDEIGFHADNTTTVGSSWAVKIAQKCYDITANSHPCFAVLGVKPFIGGTSSDVTPGITPVQTRTHLELEDLVDRAAVNLTTTGPYLSIVATELTPLGYNANYNWGFSNGAAVYAGYICGLDAWSAPTGKIIYNVDRVRYNPTRTQQQVLIDRGVVPIALNFNRVPTWVDAQTFAKDGSDYRRLTTMRIVFNAVQMVRSVAQQFIGEASNTQTRNALDTAITSGLRTMQSVGAVLDSDFTVTYVQADNKAIVDLVLRPAFELRNIEIRIAINV